MSKPKKLQLILEKDGGVLWGRVQVGDNLLFDSAASLPALEKKLRKTLKDVESLADVQFYHAYDLTVFFEQFNFLNQSRIATFAGINPGLVRQYSSGHKQPSATQVLKIEKAIRELGHRLSSVHLSANQ